MVIIDPEGNQQTVDGFVYQGFQRALVDEREVLDPRANVSGVSVLPPDDGRLPLAYRSGCQRYAGQWTARGVQRHDK